jgi:hypothetical protein
MSDSKFDIGRRTLNARPVPSIVLIAVDDKMAEVARASVPVLQIRAADLAEADWRIPIARPLVIAVGKPLSAEAASALSDLAQAVGAIIVSLDSCRSPHDVRDRLMKAWEAATAKPRD